MYCSLRPFKCFSFCVRNFRSIGYLNVNVLVYRFSSSGPFDHECDSVHCVFVCVDLVVLCVKSFLTMYYTKRLSINDTGFDMVYLCDTAVYLR